MKQRLKPLKYFKPSIVLLALAIIAIVFTNAHIIVPIILVIVAVVMAWQNYKILRGRSQEQEKDEVQTVD